VQSAFSNEITSVRWTPDGTKIWFKSQDSLFVVTVSNGAVVNRTVTLPGKIRSIDLNRASGKVAIEVEKSLKWKYNPAGSSAKNVYEVVHRAAAFDTTRQDADGPAYARGTYYQTPRWSTDGTKLAYSFARPTDSTDVAVVTANFDHAPV